MTFLDSIGSFWKNYFQFEGRASRSEFWYAQLFLVIITILFMMIETETATKMRILFDLVVIIPSISLTVRRFNDIKMPTWIPIVTGILIAVIDLLNWENIYYEEDPNESAWLTENLGWFIAGMCVMPSVKDTTKKLKKQS